MTHMLAAYAHDGDIEIKEVPLPEPREDEVLIKVHAAGVNRADLAQVGGTYPPPPGEPDVLGLEVAGVRVDTGEPVMALLAGGGYAQYVSAPLGQVLPVPAMAMTDAASLPESLATAWSNLDVCQAGPGDRVLIQGGSGSVGIIACQLARAMGCDVIATAGDEQRRERLAGFGVEAIGHDEVSNLGDIDVVLDIQGSDLGDMVKILSPGGRIAVLAIQGGNQARINVFRLMAKRASIHGTTLRSRSRDEKATIVRKMWGVAGPLIERGDLVPVVSEVVTVRSGEDVARAHDVVARAKPFGKVVLDLTSWNQP